MNFTIEELKSKEDHDLFSDLSFRIGLLSFEIAETKLVHHSNITLNTYFYFYSKKLAHWFVIGYDRVNDCIALFSPTIAPDGPPLGLEETKTDNPATDPAYELHLAIGRALKHLAFEGGKNYVVCDYYSGHDMDMLSIDGNEYNLEKGIL